MAGTINQKLRTWRRQADADPELTDIETRIRFLQKLLYDEYEPTRKPPHKAFHDRLEDWVNNVQADVDQQTLLSLVPRIFFAASKDMEAMLVSAFRQHVVQWVVEKKNLPLTSENLSREITDEVEKIWFTSLTDSGQLTRFYHVNNIQGVDWRPNWRDIAHANVTPQRLTDYMANNRLFSIVIIEDFVGSGTQLLESISPALRLPTAPQILFCPLLICPGGAAVAESIATQYRTFHFSPVLRLTEDAFVHGEPYLQEPALMAAVRELIIRVDGKVQGSNPKNNYGPFGFSRPGQRQMGGTVVLHTNCPDNTIPAIHRTSDGPWSALFPRSSRN